MAFTEVLQSEGGPARQLRQRIDKAHPGCDGLNGSQFPHLIGVMVNDPQVILTLRKGTRSVNVNQQRLRPLKRAHQRCRRSRFRRRLQLDTDGNVCRIDVHTPDGHIGILRNADRPCHWKKPGGTDRQGESSGVDDLVGRLIDDMYGTTAGTGIVT